MNNSNNYIFHVDGIHCKACVLMITSELEEIDEVNRVEVNLKSEQVSIVGEFGERPIEEIMALLQSSSTQHGYELSIEKKSKLKKNHIRDFSYAIPITVALIIIFVVLQNAGLTDFITSDTVSYGTAFFIGVIASVSTCMAIVGGLLLSMSATFAREGDKSRPQWMFHIGRILAFFILGGIIGALGTAFTLGITATVLLNVIIAIIMIVLGVHLLDVFHIAKRMLPSMPQFIAKRAKKITELNHWLTPFLVGIATFFLPCGFTQSMQLYTLTTGGFLTGGLTMLAFALGTFPVLALISFSSFSIQNNKNAGIFFKTAGLVVILFALFNIINSLVVAGVLSPVFNF